MGSSGTISTGRSWCVGKMPHPASGFRVGRMPGMVRIRAEESRHRCGLSPLNEAHLPIHQYRDFLAFLFSKLQTQVQHAMTQFAGGLRMVSLTAPMRASTGAGLVTKTIRQLRRRAGSCSRLSHKPLRRACFCSPCYSLHALSVPSTRSCRHHARRPMLVLQEAAGAL